MDLTLYGFDSAVFSGGDSKLPARIIAVHRERYILVCEFGECGARLKSSEYYAGGEFFPTVGDFVLIDYIPDGDCRIVKTLPRKTFFSRLDPSSGGLYEQAVAANFDYVFIMQSLNHDFNRRRLERYLTLAWQSGAEPVVVLSKSDLCGDATEYMQLAREIAHGVEVYAVSAKTGEGLDSLAKYLKPGKTLVFLGSSGIGKSSLLNALAGEQLMAVNTIREDDSKGRHTTTHRQLIMLGSGAMIIDTPGMRELGMWDVSSGLGEAFDDVEAQLGRCRFSDCRHQGEPGCAICAAIASGELSRERWESYQRLKGEARYSDDRKSYLKIKKQRTKNIALKNKHPDKYDF